MTLLQCIQMALDRVGLDKTNSTFKDQARLYANLAKDQLFGEAVWFWRYKEGTVTTTASTRTYDLATDVLSIFSFRDTTNDNTLQMWGLRDYDLADVDQDQTGQIQAVILEGIATDDGAIQASFYPIPDTSSESIKYRYYSYVTDWTSSDDATEMDRWLPPMAQPAIMHYTTMLYAEEKENKDVAVREESRYQEVLKRLKRQNLNVLGNQRWQREMERSGLESEFDFIIQRGSLTA